MKYLLAVLAIAIGIAAVVAGGADDSPGLQLLGVLLVVGAVVLGVRVARRSRRSRRAGSARQDSRRL
jgi:drug/metabolite transporter (DMT)-like permease